MAAPSSTSPVKFTPRNSIDRAKKEDISRVYVRENINNVKEISKDFGYSIPPPSPLRPKDLSENF